MKRIGYSSRMEMSAARRMWGSLGTRKMKELRTLLEQHKLSVSQGDVLLFDNRWYVTHAGLLRLASRRKCCGISTSLQARFCDPSINRWVFRAVVYKGPKSKGFVAYADADPSNVSPLVHGCELRMAETRATCRALRKAYAVGCTSFEELGALTSAPKPSVNSSSNGAGSHNSNGAGKAQPRLRDQLCILIRQFKLDPNLVKSYATDFCGTEVLSEASRKSVESFISHLSSAAKENRDALVCKLNSYAQPVEAGS